MNIYDNPYSAPPADYHRREFVQFTPHKTATAYVTALVFYEYCLDTSSFFDKWLLDITDAQTNDGIFPDVAPAIVYTRFAPLPPRGAPAPV
ncbi:hypothetical protein WDV76_06935 [Xenorhabdus griffiniae]|uniref:alpha-L-rhamnosidase-related protein n=1 Tax=Xenorhabdus griffiniae TaxID=351672 RepID=UPI0030D2FB84